MVNIENTDLVVSDFCLGGNMFGTAIPQAGADAILERFAELGGNFLDTARSYGDWVADAPAGASERAIGAWLRGRNRADFVIATKGGFFDLRKGDWRNRVTPDDLARDLDESLTHLGVEVIDLYWLHTDNPQAPVGPVIDALIAQQQAGKIRYFGASNWSGERILEAQSYARSIGHRGFAAIQPFWGLAVPNPDAAAAQGYGPYYDAALHRAHQTGLAAVPYAGQSRGVFSKLAAEGEAGLREDLRAMYLNDANRARLQAVQRVAARHGVGVNEVVLAYLLNQPLRTIPIIGVSRPEQLDESARAVGLKLSPDELVELEAA
jgi:aryl-alcohol dehydrogenase-like predicted oxidoreductase